MSSKPKLHLWGPAAAPAQNELCTLRRRLLRVTLDQLRLGHSHPPDSWVPGCRQALLPNRRHEQQLSGTDSYSVWPEWKTHTWRAWRDHGLLYSETCKAAVHIAITVCRDNQAKQKAPLFWRCLNSSSLALPVSSEKILFLLPCQWKSKSNVTFFYLLCTDHALKAEQKEWHVLSLKVPI